MLLKKCVPHDTLNQISLSTLDEEIFVHINLHSRCPCGIWCIKKQALPQIIQVFVASKSNVSRMVAIMTCGNISSSLGP